MKEFILNCWKVLLLNGTKFVFIQICSRHPLQILIFPSNKTKIENPVNFSRINQGKTQMLDDKDLLKCLYTKYYDILKS